jgi:hypothetical protein
MNNRNWLNSFQEQMLERAKISLNENDLEAYELLSEFAKRLQKLKIGDQSVQTPSLRTNEINTNQLIEIFDGNRIFKAQINPRLINKNKSSKCVLYSGEWFSPSKVGSRLIGYPVNGWTWWKYRDDEGNLKLIDELRKEALSDVSFS